MARIEPQFLSVQGGDGDDILIGTWDQDGLYGNGGNDVLRGEGGVDRLFGGVGHDQLFGGDDNDYLDGGAGDDLSYGGEGNDLLTDPDGGNDSMWGEGGDDHLVIDRYQSIPGVVLFLSGGDGNDYIDLRLSHLPIIDRPSAIIDGGTGDDLVRAAGLINTTINLGTGNDRLLLSGMGQHNVTLGGGHDVLELAGRTGTIIINDFEVGDFGDRINLRQSMGNAGASADPEKNPFNGMAIIRQEGPDVHVIFGETTIVLRNVNRQDLTASNFAGVDPTGSLPDPGGNFFGSAQGEQIWGSQGHDRIEGMAGDDSLIGLGGNDVIRGGAGNDSLDGGLGDDIIYGGDGNDRIEESQGAGGNDVYYGEGGSDSFSISRAVGESALVTVWGGDGDDYIGGYGLSDLIADGGDGNDSFGSSSVDRWTFDGGAGDDTLVLGHAYRNFALFFGVGTFEGGSGHDTLWLDEQSRLLDIIGIDSSTFRVGNAVMRNVEGITFGGAGSRLDLSLMTHGLTVLTDNGRNELIGSAFDDTLGGGVGEDQLDGAGGFDTAVFEQAFRYYVVETQGEVTTVRNIGDGADAYGTDTLRNIERLQFEDGWYTLDGTYIPAMVEGTAGADELRGYSWSDTLNAGAGDDVIYSSGGHDFIDGGAGNDLLIVGNIRAHYTILNVGDDFLLKGPFGATAFLTGIETLRFFDGTVVELNRMYGSGGGSVGKGGSAEPEVMPGLGPVIHDLDEPLTLPGPALVEGAGVSGGGLIPALLPSIDTGIGLTFDQDAPSRWHPDWY